MNSFDIKTVTEGALTSALSLGMSHDNAEEFTKVVIMAAAAANLGMHCAVERANKVMRMLLTRNHQDVTTASSLASASALVSARRHSRLSSRRVGCWLLSSRTNLTTPCPRARWVRHHEGLTTLIDDSAIF